MNLGGVTGNRSVAFNTTIISRVEAAFRVALFHRLLNLLHLMLEDLELQPDRIVPTPGEPRGFDPVVGRLVCTEGADRGCDYRLRTAKNSIGREPEMDSSIASDEAVSRAKHVSVVFGPEQKKFWILPGEVQGLVHLNGKAVHTPTELGSDDVIKVGQTRLMFVRFCGERFQWQ